MTVFVRGSDDAVWYRDYVGGSWGKWTSIGGKIPAGTGPAACSWGSGRLDVFVQGTNGALWHKWWNGAKWSGWESLGGKLTASPASVSPLGSGTVISVSARGTDSAVWYREWNGAAWSGWKSLGGKVAANTGPALAQYYDLFAQGTDHKLYQMSFPRGVWIAFNLEPPEVLSASSPEAVTTGFTNFHPLVCVSSTSGNVWYSVRDSVGNWDQWYSLGSPP